MKRLGDDLGDGVSPSAKRYALGGLDGFGAGAGPAGSIGQSMSDLESLRFGKGVGKGPEELRAQHPSAIGLDGVGQEPRVATSSMDFSRLDGKAMPSNTMKLPKEIAQHLMTSEHRTIIMEESGADVEWNVEARTAVVRGSNDQVKAATKLLERVRTHCHWGSREEKVRTLLRPRMIEKALCRLSPMDVIHKLRTVDKSLSAGQTLSIGKGKENDAIVNDAIVSRVHCLIELDDKKGTFYVTDMSTNGTFLNGFRLPSAKQGKVLLSHGDELLLKDPASGNKEFGYIVNINVLTEKPEVKLEAPRRTLTSAEIADMVFGPGSGSMR